MSSEKYQILFFNNEPEKKGPTYDDFGKEEENTETQVKPVYYWCSQNYDFGDI